MRKKYNEWEASLKDQVAKKKSWNCFSSVLETFSSSHNPLCTYIFASLYLPCALSRSSCKLRYPMGGVVIFILAVGRELIELQRERHNTNRIIRLGSFVTVLHVSAPLWEQGCWMKRSKPDRFVLQDLLRGWLGFTMTFYFYFHCLEIFWVGVSIATDITFYIGSKKWKVKKNQGS